MTIPRRADMASGDPHSAARLKLLAELPHMGEDAAVAPLAAPANTRKSTHPAFADYDNEAVTGTAQTRTRSFVDQAHGAHTDDEWTDDALERHKQRCRTDRPLIHRQRQAGHPSYAKSGVGGLLSQAHRQVAPFAGLIVTAALVAAAGLLFHMMAGDNKPNAEIDDLALPGFRVDAIENPLLPSVSAPLAEISTTSEGLELESASTTPAELTPSENPVEQAPAVEVSAQSSPPLANAIVEPTTPLGQLSFPLTGTPLALDYSKATDPDLQTLPEVAERTEASATEGINR